MPKKVWKNNHIFIISVFYVCRQFSYQNLCVTSSKRLRILFPNITVATTQVKSFRFFSWSLIFFAFIKMDETKWAGVDSCSALMEAPFLNNDAITYPLSVSLSLSLFIPFNSVCLSPITLSLWIYKFILTVSSFVYLLIFLLLSLSIYNSNSLSLVAPPVSFSFSFTSVYLFQS